MAAEHGAFIDVDVADFSRPGVDVTENLFVEAPEISEIHDACRGILPESQDAQRCNVAFCLLQQVPVGNVQFVFQNKRIRIAVNAVLFKFIIVILHSSSVRYISQSFPG